MALKVWLPLNGSTENIGLNGDIINWTTTPTYTNNGKIGQALATGGATMPAAMTAKILNNQAVSIACWLYVNADADDATNRAMIFGNDSMNSLGGRQFSIFRYPNADDIHLSWQNCINGTYTSIIGTVASGVLTPRAWNHVCVTYQNPNVSLYINGIKTNTYTATMNTDSFAFDTHLIWTSTSHYINDFRIYDNCLSAKEVKEIAQGLVLHYKLDGFNGGVGDNLAFGTNTANTSTNTWRLSLQTGGTSNSIEYDGDTPVAVITRNDVAHSGWAYLHYDNIHAADIKPSTTYTISFDVKTSVDGNITFTGLCQGNATNYKTKSTSVIQGICTANQWCHIIIQCITKDDFTDLNNSQVIYLNTSTSLRGTNVTLKMKNMKMEEGSIATAWTPASSELGIDASTVPDSSGYEHDGIAAGTLTTSSDSPRYNVSTVFDGSTSRISLTNFYIGNEWSYGCWVYSPTSSRGWEGVILLNNNGGDADMQLGFYTYPGGTRIQSTANGQYNSGIAFTYEQWNHLFATFDGTNLKTYINGILVNTKSITNALLPRTNLTIGARSKNVNGASTSFDAPFAGRISDVRIYTTVLSADDIADLYHTPLNVDNLGNMHTFEFAEDDGNSTSQNGLTHVNIITQHTNLPFYSKYDNALYFEPDGSAWMHIYHHNHPDLGSFASGDTFTTGVYKDANRWFDATHICNSLTQWEFLIKYAYTEGGTEYKERWIQTKNPEVAVFGDVDAADITRITGNGYKTGTWGGIYRKNSSAYWVMNNANSSNWWGAMGSFSVYQGGIPGYGGTVTTTGYNDLYVRIDNLPWNNFDHASIVDDGTYRANNFIEK